MKHILVIISLVASTLSFAQDLTDRSKKYSDVKVKCKAEDESLSLYVTAKGDIFRSQSNEVTWAVYSSSKDWFLINKKNKISKNLMNGYWSERISHSDPYGFEYEIRFEDKVYFTNGKVSKATLKRSHDHPEINLEEEFELKCKTSVTVTNVDLKPLTVGRFNRIKKSHKAYVLASSVDVYTGERFEIDDLSADLEDLYGYYAQTALSKSVTSLSGIRNITSAQKNALKKILKTEQRDNEFCIEERLDYVDEEYREEVLENWSICAYDVYVVRDINKVVLGFVVDRFNDNGVDDSDGHDGSVSVYTSRGEELAFEEWYP